MFSYLRRKQVIQSAGIASRYFTTANSATQNVIAADARYKRSVFHSKQRGWLELDLIMGTWAKQNKDKLIADPSYLEKVSRTLFPRNGFPPLMSYLPLTFPLSYIYSLLLSLMSSLKRFAKKRTQI